MSKQSRLSYDIHDVFASPLEESTVVYTAIPDSEGSFHHQQSVLQYDNKPTVEE